MAIYAIFNVAIQNRKLADVRMRGFYVEKVYCLHQAFKINNNTMVFNIITQLKKPLHINKVN